MPNHHFYFTTFKTLFLAVTKKVTQDISASDRQISSTPSSGSTEDYGTKTIRWDISRTPASEVIEPLTK